MSEDQREQETTEDDSPDTEAHGYERAAEGVEGVEGVEAFDAPDVEGHSFERPAESVE